MKDNSLDGHRGKVAVSDTTRVTPASSSGKCDLKTSTTVPSDGAATTNFDDDYNEWELGIGDLIIDLDADIEKTNPNHHHHHYQNGTVVGNSPGTSTAVSPSSAVGATSFAFLGSQSCSPAMSNSKSSRVIGGTNNCGSSGSTTAGASVVANNTGGSTGAIEHQATVDKGLKMKIKRKTVGSKYSEAKHEIVQSDTKTMPSHPLCENLTSNNCVSSQNSTPVAETKSKHSSSKGRNGSHREKKEKNRDKDKGSSTKTLTPSVEVNGVLIGVTPSLKITNSGVSIATPPVASGTNPPPPPLPPPSQNGSAMPSNSQTPAVCRSVTTTSCSSSNSAAGGGGTGTTSTCATTVQECSQTTCSTTNVCSPPMPNLTLKLENKYSGVQPPLNVVQEEDRPMSPPLKRMKLEDSEKVDIACSPVPPEMKDTSTCTSVGTITEPDCLGPCEPGTSVTLEGIVWQETEGGVLVVNVTWRGKTYVGTLLDCTKHDWAPPRFCESPTSDVDSKTAKGRGKRGRGSNTTPTEVNTYNESRNSVQSKLRNGKGRRTTVNSNNSTASGFTVPNSPAKSENGTPVSTKRKGRPSEIDISLPQSESKNAKRSRSQSRGTPTLNAASTSEFSQPSSPVLIECPEPNCSKKYKHINGLRYHQTHAHSGSDGGKTEDGNNEDSSKDVTNSSDNEESIQESMSVPPSPAMSFTNAASPHPSGGRTSQSESISSSCNTNSLPESDQYSLTPDLSTLASVAINDSKASQKSSNLTKVTTLTVSSNPPASQELPTCSQAEDVKTLPSTVLPVTTLSASPCSTPSASSPPAISLATTSESCSLLVPAVATTSVIHSSSTVDTPSVISPPVTVSIPTSHVVFSQSITVGGNSVTTTTHTTSTVVCHNSTVVPAPRTNLSTTTTSTFSSVTPPVTSTTVLCNSPISSVSEKVKIKQERPDKYKPKSPLTTTAIRPIVPAPSAQLIALSANIPISHPSNNTGAHSLVTSSLKPIQPKPTILGEPTTINPALESLKKEKSKHKKKSKDKDREKKVSPVSIPPAKHVSSHPNEEPEPMEITPFPNLEAVSGTRDAINPSVPLSSSTHGSISPLSNQSKPPDSSLDMSMEDNMNENIQSPAYSDISDANDTAPVLESEVPSVKEKEEKVGKTTPDTAQSPAANMSAYGMYPYYSQPPYLLPSVSPQNSVPGSQGSSVGDKSDPNKKLEQERMKESSRPWSNPSGEIPRERSSVEHDSSEKKPMREDSGPNPNVASPNPSAAALTDYPIQQPYPYSYGYVQGYQYSMDPSYHMHLLESDPHYKHQYKQYLEEQQQRLYKEQQHQHHHQQQQHHHQLQQQHHHHHQQQQQQQQQHQQQHHHHHHQQQQQHHHHHQQQQNHHSHQHHHSPHHQSKSQHHSSVSKDERSREKERSSVSDKLSSSGLVDHSKSQHSSISLVVNKDESPREIETRPPSLPAQSRMDNSTSSASAAALKEKQNENHQILKENIELKSQMDASKKVNQFEMAMLYERHREDVRRYYIYQERYNMEQQQQQQQQPPHKVEADHHHHQLSQQHAPSSSSSSLKPHKEDSSLVSTQSKPNHFPESSRSSSVISPPKSDHNKNSTSQPNATSSPKTSVRETSVSNSKDYINSGAISSTSSKKEGINSSSKSSMDRLDGSSREEKTKSEKGKIEMKVEPEGQKPTMETTGPPPPPTNTYAYLHPSYLQPPPPHFPHMPFEPTHAVYRSGINPMIMSSPHYSNSPYMHPQLRYVPPGACDLPSHSQAADPLGNKLHAPAPAKALDLLHQVSQHYTTHKIHELQEHALMSPTPTSTPSTPSTPSSSSSTTNSKVSSTEPISTIAKMEPGGPRESSPPTQRHLHTHHHTHVGVGYPIYDPYGVAQQHWKQSQNQRQVPYRLMR